MTEPPGEIHRECVEGYLFATPPFEILLFRRPPSRGRIWVPVSGKTEPGDRDFESALARELKEETGLVAPVRTFPLDWHVTFTADNGETWRLHAYGVEVPRSFRPRLSAEHEAWGWFAAAEAAELLHYPDNREAAALLVRSLESGPARI